MNGWSGVTGAAAVALMLGSGALAQETVTQSPTAPAATEALTDAAEGAATEALTDAAEGAATEALTDAAEGAATEALTDAAEGAATEALTDAAEGAATEALGEATTDAVPADAEAAGQEAATDPATDTAAGAGAVAGDGLAEQAWQQPEEPLASVLELVDLGDLAEETRATTWIGHAVQSEQGTEIGTIRELILVSPRRIGRAVIGLPKGALGLRETDIVVPARYLRAERAEDGGLRLVLAIGDIELQTTIESRQE